MNTQVILNNAKDLRRRADALAARRGEDAPFVTQLRQQAADLEREASSAEAPVENPVVMVAGMMSGK